MVSIMVVIFVKWVCSKQGCNSIDEKRRGDGNENAWLCLLNCVIRSEDRSEENYHVIKMDNIPSQTFKRDQHFGGNGWG